MLKQHKILVVDDDAVNLDVIEEALDNEYNIKTCLNGEETLNVIEQYNPDIVLLDIMMPGIDGYEVCQKIRENPNLYHTKIIFISAKEMLKDRLAGYQVGGDDYIVKPFEEEELRAKVKVFLRLKYEEEIKSLNKIANQKDQSTVYKQISQYFSSILYIHSQFPYCKIVCLSTEINPMLIRTSLKELEKQFKENDLLRVHKSYLVNPIKIVFIRKKGTQDFEITLKDNENNIALIPAGRKYHTLLKNLNPSWFSE